MSFHGRIISGLSLMCALLCVSLGWCADRFILDSHYHARGSDEWIEKTVEIYRANNAMCCVLTPMQHFARVSEAIRKYPDVFIGYGQVRPDDPNAVREIEEFYRAGFVGMKFISPELNWDDPKYFQLYRLCENYGLVLLFHTGVMGRFQVDDEPRMVSTARMRPVYLDLIAREFPRALIQGAHFGNPWYEEAAEVSRWNPNLFFDISGSSLLKMELIGETARFRKILWWGDKAGKPHAFGHILFGTDAQPEGLTENIRLFGNFIRENEVPDSVAADMWGLTLARFLDLDPATHRFRRPRPLPPGSVRFRTGE